MAKRNGSPERRKHKRFKVKAGPLAVSIPDFKKLGQIKDISKGGLAFQYIENGDQTKEPVGVEILSIVGGYYLSKLPVRTVLDVEVDYTGSLNLSLKRQLSLEFGKLNYHQKVLLEHFIQKYTHK